MSDAETDMMRANLKAREDFEAGFIAWEAWKCCWRASRAAALEEAEKACDALNPHRAQFPDFDGGYETGIESCTEAIRALAAKTKGE